MRTRDDRFETVLKQIFLRKDIETLRRIVLDPEEINRIVKQIETTPESLHEYEELEEVQLLTDMRQIPDVKCDIIDGKCFTVELPMTDLIDPDHNLRRLLRDLQTHSKTLTKNITRQIEIKEKQSTPATKRKSRKRSNRKIVKMRPITTYFPVVSSRFSQVTSFIAIAQLNFIRESTSYIHNTVLGISNITFT